MLVREAREKNQQTETCWEPRLIEVRHAGHQARTGAVIGRLQQASKVGSCPKRENTKWSTDGWLEMKGLPWELQGTYQTISRTKQRHRWQYRDQKSHRDNPLASFTCSIRTLASTAQRLVAKRVRFVFRGAKSSVRHSDECRQRVMEAVEADGEGRMRTFLDKNAPRRTAPDIVGGGCGGAPRSRSGGARPSPMEAGSEERAQHKREQSGSSAPSAAGKLEQRQAKRVRFESSEEPSQDGRKRLCVQRASETDAEELEPCGVVIPQGSCQWERERPWTLRTRMLVLMKLVDKMYQLPNQVVCSSLVNTRCR